MRKRKVFCNNRILALFLAAVLLCCNILYMIYENVEALAEDLMYINTTSFTETNTGVQGSGREYQLSGAASLTKNGEVELVPNVTVTKGTLFSTKKITVTTGFSAAFKLSYGEGTDFLAGTFEMLLSGTDDYAVNAIGFDIYRQSDTEIATAVKTIAGEVTGTRIISLPDFTEEGTVNTGLYCWLDYSQETKELKVFLSPHNKRPDTAQAIYTDLDIATHMGTCYKVSFCAENPSGASQQTALSSFFLDNKYISEGIDIAACLEQSSITDTYTKPYTLNYVTYTLTVHYIYAENGTSAAVDYKVSYKEGQAYSVTSPSIVGYEPDKSVVKGVFGSADIELTVKYNKQIDYEDLPGSPSADVITQSQIKDIWAKMSDTDEVYENISRPVRITVKQWDNSSLAGVEVSAFQLMCIGADGYVINSEYQDLFDTELGQKNVSAETVEEWFLSMNNQNRMDFISRVIQYNKDKSLTPINSVTGEAGDTSMVVDCSRRYEQSKGYYAGYGYYVLYSEDTAGVEYVMAEFASENAESSVYLKGNSLDLVKEVGKQDYSMNEDILFTISSTIPNLDEASDLAKYRYFITDTYDEGITPYIDTIQVQTVDADESIVLLTKDDDYTVVEEESTIKIVCNFYSGTHLKNNAQKGKTLRVTYKACLNEKAVIGPLGNRNKAFLTYTGNPAESEYTDKTTVESSVVVYTYTLQMRKVGSDGYNLGNVEFQVYDYLDNKIFFLKGDDGVYRPVKEKTQGAVSKITTNESGMLYIDGVGTGDYTFEEVRAPRGYLKIPEFSLIVAPEYMDYNLIKLVVSVENGIYIRSVDCYRDTGKIEFIVVDPSESGQLPMTGGKGKIIIYAAGFLLISVGMVLTVNKRKVARVSDDEDCNEKDF